MSKDIPNIEVEQPIDRTAAEFLRAREVRLPETIEELQQATTSANDEIERVLFQRDRWQGMKRGKATKHRRSRKDCTTNGLT